MFIEIFLVLCFTAQPQFCRRPEQPVKGIGSPSVNQGVTIFSLINGTGNCSAFNVYTLESKYRHVQEYCERPFPAMFGVNEFISHDMALCMVLYDAAQRVCEVEHQTITNGIPSSNFSCDTMIKTLPETTMNSTKLWVTFLKAEFKNISNCKQACARDNLINPVCEYILRANVFIQEAQVSSTVSVDISRAEVLVPEDHGEVQKTHTDKEKTSEKKVVLAPVDPQHSMQSDESKKTENSHHTTTVTNRSSVDKVDPTEANGNSTQSNSGNSFQNATRERTQMTNSSTQTDIKNDMQTKGNTLSGKGRKQTHTANSDKQIDSNANSKNSSVQNEEAHPNNINRQPTEGVALNAAASVSKQTEHTQEVEKYDDSTRQGISFGSKSDAAPQSENKNSAAVNEVDPEIQNQSGDNEDSFMPTDENYSKLQDTDNEPNGDEDQIDKINIDHPGEQREEMPKETETGQEEAETGNTAQLNQLGDADDSHFYAYFMTMVVICIIGYLVFHNKQKILALALEGRSRRGTRRRPNTSAYRKLDSNLEEAVTSTCSTSVTHVIY